LRSVRRGSRRHFIKIGAHFIPLHLAQGVGGLQFTRQHLVGEVWPLVVEPVGFRLRARADTRRGSSSGPRLVRITLRRWWFLLNHYRFSVLGGAVVAGRGLRPLPVRLTRDLLPLRFLVGAGLPAPLPSQLWRAVIEHFSCALHGRARDVQHVRRSGLRHCLN